MPTRTTVLPLRLSTTAPGLFKVDLPALAYRSADKVEPHWKTLSVQARSSSVGSNTTQLAVTGLHQYSITTARL
ncbi:hypothetical protein F4679DRAFT_536932 [Xylaria curta]|nr:hypothetical protein F4679DRAFT_536932 [Xylaria curta]